MADSDVARIEQLAPDAASAKAGLGLAKPALWRNLGQRDGVVWGECQGSGANPYQVRAALGDIGYKCSCPSRKQPCKHVLGLLFLHTGGAVTIADATAPGFVEEWLANRSKRSEAKAARAAAAETAPPDPEAQAKRIERRESRIELGLDQLQAWLIDSVNQGLAALRAQPDSHWKQMSARMVDAQAPGLARRVTLLAEDASSGALWQPKLLAGLARLQLLVDAYRRIDALPPELAAEVRTLVGWTQKQEELVAQEGIRDHWHVIARRLDEQDTLRTQSTWLAGAGTGRLALLLEFAVGRAPLPVTFAAGEVLEAELVFYPGPSPVRALLKSCSARSASGACLPPARDVAALQAGFGQALARNPWLDRWPVVLGPVVPVMKDGRCTLVDATGRSVNTTAAFRHGWSLVALAGHGPVTTFGDWDGFELAVHAVEGRGGLYGPSELGSLAVFDRVG